jgi:hypothetical protein
VRVADQPLEAGLLAQPGIVGFVKLNPAGHSTTILRPRGPDPVGRAET